MSFQQPVWFLLLIPLACMLYYWRLSSRFLFVLRVLLFISVVLAMVGLTLRFPARSGMVVVVADRSRSMPSDSDITEKHAINLLLSHIGDDDRLGVISFGLYPFSERLPIGRVAGEFNNFQLNNDLDASNLHDAIDHALTIIPRGIHSRLLVISDGRWTGESPDQLISRLVQRGIPIDYRFVERTHVGDVAVLSLDAPERVLPNEVFKVTGVIYVPVAQNIMYDLTCNGQKAASGIRQMDAGSNKIEFMLKAGMPGTMQCNLQVKSVIDTEDNNLDNNKSNNTNSTSPKLASTLSKDPVPENNFARCLVGVEGDKPLLVLVPQVSGVESPQSKFAEILRNSGLDVVVSDGTNITWNLAVLSNYSGIVLDNVPASQIGTAGMELISAWVKETGAGLMFTGGKNAYALGGYHKSPFDPIMPVSMELRKEHRKLAIAVAVLMDCSGSMGMEVPGGKMKMELADAGAAEVLNILTPLDEVAVYTCDTSVQTIIPLKLNTEPQNDMNRILSVGPGGGGIFVYTGLSKVTFELAKASAETKHVILFTDADDTEEPKDYKNLLTACRKIGMTCSVIALGTPKDSTANLCIDIAKVGGGNIYFTENANDLPRLFAQDTFAISRSTFLEEATSFKFSGGMLTLSNTVFSNPPSLGGYNLCYLKEKSILSAVTEDEYNAPIIASWQAGIGRVLCYMGQVDGKFTGAISSWDDYNQMLVSFGKWTAGKANLLPNNMMLTQSLDNGGVQIRLHLDPENDNFLEATPVVSLLVQKQGGVTETRKLPMKWHEHDLLGVTVPLSGEEILQATVLLSDKGELKPFSLPPVCAPNSPEFKPPDQTRSSGAMLRQLAVATGGIERIELPRIWRDIPKTPRVFELSQWLIYFAILCVVAEIFQRRTGLITSWAKRFLARFQKTATKNKQPENNAEQETNNNETEKAKVLSLFQLLRLRKKAREVINVESSAQKTQAPQPQTTPAEQTTSKESSPEQSDNVIDAINKAKLKSIYRTRK
ncbi:MAG: VWA domain-containing protein [Planctomycetaceae bacterium]|jgi:uncharacterized membrane protein/Mg-chelatase subunit ChlD|nr:VWA domain-containing protein [Planctomycetaceae bacterium]